MTFDTFASAEGNPQNKENNTAKIQWKEIFFLLRKEKN